MGKQILIDILVVLAVPVLLIGGYYFWKTDDGTLLSLLSSDIALPGDEGKELGAKTKLALVTLGSIDFDETFFSNDAFASLQDLTATVSSTPLGREYPFSTPDVIKRLLKNATPGKSMTAAPTKIAPTADINAKIETLKTGTPQKPK